jgi:hypothetical protein
MGGSDGCRKRRLATHGSSQRRRSHGASPVVGLDEGTDVPELGSAELLVVAPSASDP